MRFDESKIIVSNPLFTLFEAKRKKKDEIEKN